MACKNAKLKNVDKQSNWSYLKSKSQGLASKIPWVSDPLRSRVCLEEQLFANKIFILKAIRLASWELRFARKA